MLAHKGMSDELADRKAKIAVRLGIDTQIGISTQDFKLLWKDEMFEKFFDRCKTSGSDCGFFYFKNYFLFSRRS